MKKIRLGEILVQVGYITEEQLENALMIQKSSEKKRMLGEVLIELGYVREEEILSELSRQLQVPVLSMEQLTSTAEVIATIPREIAVKLNLIPLYFEDNNLYVATDNPLNYYGFQELEEQIGKQVVPYLAKKEHIAIAIEQAYANKNLFNVVNEANQLYGRDYQEKEMSETYQQMMDRIDSSPVVKLVNSILTQAVTMQASDIHIEPKQNNVLVRFRIDGDLMEVMVLNAAIHTSLVTRFKIISSLGIAEKRIPQDGRFSLDM